MSSSQGNNNQVVVIVAIVSIAILAVGGVVGLTIYDAKNSTPAITSILGFAATIIVSLFTLLGVKKNIEANTRIQESVEQNNEEAKVRTAKTQAQIKEVKESLDVKVAGEIIRIEEMPETREALQRIIDEAVKKACGELKNLEDSNKELHLIKHNLLGLRQQLTSQSDLFKSLNDECFRLENMKAQLEADIEKLKGDGHA